MKYVHFYVNEEPKTITVEEYIIQVKRRIKEGSLSKEKGLEILSKLSD